MGDRGWPVTGKTYMVSPCGSDNPIGTEEGSGCMEAHIGKGMFLWGGTGKSDKYIHYLRINTSRVAPTGAANVPRSWGSLACAYFGQPSAA